MKLISILILIPLMATCLAWKEPRSCHEVEQDKSLPSKVYTIYPVEFGYPVKVFCDMDTDRGRWTVFQRRLDGALNFYKPWVHYRDGFGDPYGEYWLGLENIYHLTKDGNHELRVVMEDFEGNKVYTQYDSFRIDDESNGYALHVSGFQRGGAGDSLSYHDGQKFSTFDNDQDGSSSNCAQRYLGGFWYRACYRTNPNGIYQWGPVADFFSNGIIWARFRGNSYSLKAITMMTRPHS